MTYTQMIAYTECFPDSKLVSVSVPQSVGVLPGGNPTGLFSQDSSLDQRKKKRASIISAVTQHRKLQTDWSPEITTLVISLK